MSEQAVDSEPMRGNRTSYDGAELLMTLWVLMQFDKEKESARLAKESARFAKEKESALPTKEGALPVKEGEAGRPAKEEEGALLAKEVHKRAVEHFGSEAVPGEKKIRKCLETLVDWTNPSMVAGAEGSSADVSVPALCTVIPRVEKKAGKRSEFRYCVYPHRNPDMQDLCEDLGVSLDLACQAQIEQAALIKELPRTLVDEAGDGDDANAEARAARDKAAYRQGASYFLPDNGRRPVIETLAMVVTLRRAIEDKQAISFIRVGYRPLKSSKGSDGSYEVNGFQDFNLGKTNAINDENRDCKCRWPYAVKHMDGQYYLLVNATGNRDKLASYPLAEMSELTIIDPDDPHDHWGDPLDKVGSRPNLDRYVAGYYDGAVLGWGSHKDKADIKLLCKGDGFQDVYQAFCDFEGFTVYKGNPAEQHDGVEKVERPNAPQSLNSNAWYTVCFKAHPHGVEEWVKQHLRDAKILEPEKSAKQIDKYLSGIRFDRWQQILDSPSCKKAVVPDEIAKIDGLEGDEKRLLAAYRAYKARKGAGK